MFKSIVTIAAFLSLNVAVAAETVIQHAEATKHYGHKMTVEGTVVATSCDGKKCYLNFNQDFRKALSVIIETADIAKFTKATTTAAQQADMDTLYKGKKVHVTGVISEYKSKSTNTSRPQMSLSGPADIKVK